MTPTQVLMTAKTKNCNLCRHDFARVLAKTRWNNRAVVVTVTFQVLFFTMLSLFIGAHETTCTEDPMQSRELNLGTQISFAVTLK